MAITSLNTLIAALSAGQRWRTDFNKITGGSAYTAGRSYDMSALGGHPIANAWAGTALTFTECDESTGNGTQIFGIRHGGNVSPDVKNLLNMGAVTTAATGIPSTLLLVDIEGYWPTISNNTTSAQTLSGTPSTRATNGEGLRLYWVQTAIAGATAQNISLSYTDQAGNTGNALPVTVAMTASAIVGHISHAGTAANNYGPFLPLASGDYGVRNVASVTFSAANTGTGALVLAKPLIEIPLGITSLYHDQRTIDKGMPIITDGACLGLILVAGSAVAASTTFMGHVQTVWD